jgi:DNA-binding PadR family transcriptional regulator
MYEIDMERRMSKENKSRYALLGMLSLIPMSGYDLKRTISYSIGNFWNESYPQIYPLLKQLTEEGLTTSRAEKTEGRPERHIYTLTEKGWQELQHWLGEPFEYQIERNELLLKLFFGSQVRTEISLEHVRRHRAVQAELLHRYEQTEATLKTDMAENPKLPYWLLTLSYGKHIAAALIAWCDEAIALLEQLAKSREKQDLAHSS